jgi:hypothetical protein
MTKLVIAVSTWILMGFLFAWSDRQTVDEKAELFDRKEKILQLAGPKGRIIIAGGSNIFWGVSSSALEEVFKRPVINLSIPSEIEDPELMRALALKAAKAGDVLVYSTLSFWLDPGTNKARALRIAKRLQASDYVSAHVSILDRIGFWWRPYPEEINPATALVRGMNRENLVDPWSPFMDAHGDYQACKDIFVNPIPFAHHREPEKFAKEILEFERQVQKKGAFLVNTAPWILVDPAEKDLWLEHYVKVLSLLDKQHKVLPFAHPELALRHDQSEFCECAWHLKHDMGLQRTQTFLQAEIESVLMDTDAFPVMEDDSDHQKG